MKFLFSQNDDSDDRCYALIGSWSVFGQEIGTKGGGKGEGDGRDIARLKVSGAGRQKRE